MNRNRTTQVCLGLFGCLALSSVAFGQEGLQQKVAAAKQAAAHNKQALRNYSWLQQMEASYKGESKKTTLNSCRYAPDGSVEKTLVSSSPAPEEKRGLRGKIIEKKKAEMKDEAERAAMLVHRYVPPSPEAIQAVVAQNGASLTTAGPGVVALVFKNYVKPGDSMTLSFESQIKKLQRVNVSTYLDDPTQPVTLDVEMQSLPDGTNYPAVEVLGLPASHLEIRIQNTNYQRLANQP
jgi:hypothetical protein